jgi:hypothetical protein
MPNGHMSISAVLLSLSLLRVQYHKGSSTHISGSPPLVFAFLCLLASDQLQQCSPLWHALAGAFAVLPASYYCMLELLLLVHSATAAATAMLHAHACCVLLSSCSLPLPLSPLLPPSAHSTR